MSRRMHIPDRRFRRRVTIAAVVTVTVLAGAGAAMASVTDNRAMPRPAPTQTPVVVTVAPTPMVDPRDSSARTRLRVDLLAALQTTIAAADAALAGTDTAAILDARTAVNTAQRAVETTMASWAALQLRAATDAKARADAAEQQKQAAAQTKKQPGATPPPVVSPQVAPAPPVAPAPVKVAAPVDPPPVPVDPVLAARGANAWFTADLNGIGATGFTICGDWATKCKQSDSGERYIQGCARSDDASVIYMKPVAVEVAASETARGVVIHEWAHLLQCRLGFAAVTQATDAVFGVGLGLEQSADCMAIALGATGKPGGYTDDCSGARGELAAALVAGHLP